MRDWITPVALEELSAAYTSLGLDYQPLQALERGRFSFSQERVTVHLTERRRVQILEVSIFGLEHLLGIIINTC
jgi:hypothetical protein